MTSPGNSDANYQELVKQNWGFLSPEDQDAIAHCRVLLAGCGLGSNIAVLAARTGFCRFALADGDTVELSNLNRQAFRTEHVGRNKAEVTADLVREINPEAEVEVMPVFLEAQDAERVVSDCDLVVNMVDPGPVLEALLQVASAQGKITLFPLNVAFGGLLLAFGPESPPLDSLMGPKGGDFFVDIIQRLMPSLPQYLWQYVWVAMRIQQEGIPPPQLGVAAGLSASLVVGGMVKAAQGAPLATIPSAHALDSREPPLITWPTA